MGLLIPHQLRGGGFSPLDINLLLDITLLNTGQSRSGGKVKGPVIRIFCKQKSRFKQTLPI